MAGKVKHAQRSMRTSNKNSSVFASFKSRAKRKELSNMKYEKEGK